MGGEIICLEEMEQVQMVRDLKLDEVEALVNLVVKPLNPVKDAGVVVVDGPTAKTVNNMKCELCNREIPLGYESKHHLVPKCCGGHHGDTAIFHEVCHKQVHALFSEPELQVYYYTVQRLKNHKDVKRFIKWVSKRPVEFNSKTKIRRKRR